MAPFAYIRLAQRNITFENWKIISTINLCSEHHCASEIVNELKYLCYVTDRVTIESVSRQSNVAERANHRFEEATLFGHTEDVSH